MPKPRRHRRALMIGGLAAVVVLTLTAVTLSRRFDQLNRPGGRVSRHHDHYDHHDVNVWRW